MGFFSRTAGRAPTLRRLHGQQRAASDAARWGLCWASIGGALVSTAREWCSACVARLDPCLGSDVLARTPPHSWVERRARPQVGFLCCIPNAPALLRTIGCLSRLALRVRREQKAPAVSLVALASSCGGLVHGWRFGPSDSVDAVGMGVFIASYLPDTTILANDCRARLGPGRALRGRPGSCGAGVSEECYLVDPASSHMLVSKIKPCMCKYEQIQTVKLRMAH